MTIMPLVCKMSISDIKFKEFSNRSTRIPDVIIFINGLPLVVMELKSFQGFEDKLLEDAILF